MLLLAEQRTQSNPGNLHNLEANARDIPDRVTLSAKTRHQNFVVFIDKIQTTVSRDEARNLLTVLDELHANALTNSRVWLFRFDTNLFQDNAFGVRATSEWLFPLGTQVGFVIIFVRPSLLATVQFKLTAGP